MIINGAIFNVGWLLFFYRVLTSNIKDKISYHISPVVMCIIFCVSLWGIQPYLGLSNIGNLTMFSNLVTEKSRSNHFLVNTMYTKVLDFEEDYLRIIKLPKGTKWDDRYSIDNYDVPVITFKNMSGRWAARLKGKLPCTILYKGKVIKIDDLRTSSFRRTEWWHRFLHYRRIPLPGVNECMW
jgi:hypothetical protein